MTHYRVVLTTTPDIETARTIARKVVESRLAACVNVVPKIESYYIWEGELQEDSEALLVMKTAGHLVAELERFITSIHPYEVPEFIALRVEEGGDKYLEWIDQVTKG